MRIYLGQGNNSGICIDYIKSKKRIEIRGWYDGSLGHIPGGAVTLKELFDRLGITEDDCHKVWKKK